MKLKYRTPAGLTYYPYLVEMIEGKHTLIAGTTGAGKSVLENAIIYSLLCCKFPGGEKSCKFIFIDPKRVELDLYKKLPHTLYYVDSIPDIIKVLEIVKEIINQRLAAMKKKRLRATEETPIYIFIDEIVTIIENKQYKKRFLELLTDILSISRACNIFAVIATQSPARGMIPATVQINCNCKVALRCNNRIESQQIIGESGAEDLPKHGLAIVRQDIEKYQIKIPLIPDPEIIQLVKFWERQHPIINALTRQKLN